MARQHYYKGNLNFRDKLFAFDYILALSILLLGVISIFAMYSTEQGKIGYYTQSHLYRFSAFFLVFIILSFLKIKFAFSA